MDHFVALDRLPEGLRIPPDLADRLHFDPQRRRLSFQGAMYKAEYDRLCDLSEDWSYRRQLEELFRLSVSPEVRRPLAKRLAPAALIAAALVVILGVALWHPWKPGAASPQAQGSPRVLAGR
jgi:hypothetical protein